MRLIAFILAAFVVSGPAAAQTWQEYTNPDYSFTVMFPAAPQIETTTYQVAVGRSVPAHVYTVRQNKGLFKVTVADLANTGLTEEAVIDHAVKMLSAGGEVTVNFPHRIYQVYGRQLSIKGADGSRSTVAMFDSNGRLYQIEAKVLPGGNDTDLIRFQQSLIFDRDKVSNRSADTVRAIKEACAGRPNQPNNPAGLDDPRCVRQ
jgi:glutamine amidotransferase PdxT